MSILDIWGGFESLSFDVSGNLVSGMLHGKNFIACKLSSSTYFYVLVDDILWNPLVICTYIHVVCFLANHSWDWIQWKLVWDSSSKSSSKFFWSMMSASSCVFLLLNILLGLFRLIWENTCIRCRSHYSPTFDFSSYFSRT